MNSLDIVRSRNKESDPICKYVSFLEFLFCMFDLAGIQMDDDAIDEAFETGKFFDTVSVSLVIFKKIVFKSTLLNPTHISCPTGKSDDLICNLV